MTWSLNAISSYFIGAFDVRVTLTFQSTVVSAGFGEAIWICVVEIALESCQSC